MGFDKLSELMAEFIQEDRFPERKLNEQLHQLNIPDRVNYLNYIKDEFERGVIHSMLRQRYEEEEPPQHLDYSNKELTPRDSFLLHIQDLREQLETICIKNIPEMLKDYQRQFKDQIDRQKAMERYGFGSQVNPLEEELFTKEQAAEFLGVEVSTISNHIYMKRLHPYTTGKRRLIPKSQLLALFKKV